MENLNGDIKAPNECKACNNSNTLIFTVGRMNPPTPGHLELIREMLTFAKAKNITQVYIFLSETRGAKDPIPCADKVAVLTGSYDPANNSNIWANVAEFARDSMLNDAYANADKVAKANEVAALARSAANAAAAYDNAQPKLKSMIQSLKDDMSIDVTVNTICFSGSTVFKYIDYYANKLQKTPDSKSVYLVGFFGGDRDDFGLAIEKSFKNKYSYFAPQSSPRAGMEKFKNLYTNNPELLIVDKGHPDYHSMADIVNAGAMSASLVRLIVKQGFKDRFTELYQPYLDADSIDKLYNAINQGMQYYTQIAAEEAAAKSAVISAKAAAKSAKAAATPVKSSRPSRKFQPLPTGGRKTRKTRKIRKTRKQRKTRSKRKGSRRKRSTI